MRHPLRFSNLPPGVFVRFADPDSITLLSGSVTSQHADQVRAIRGPIKNQGRGGFGEDLARGLCGQIEIKQAMPSVPQLLDVQNSVFAGMPADREVGGNV